MSHFDTVPTCDRQTDGRTDRRIYYSIGLGGWPVYEDEYIDSASLFVASYADAL